MVQLPNAEYAALVAQRDTLLALASRLAYPEAGELLTLDDYRNIARNIIQPDGRRVA